MREHITAYSIANEIRMKRSVHKGAFLIVEGSTDSKLYKKFLDTNDCRVIIAHNKEKAVDALNILEKDAFKGALAIVDADFSIAQGDELSSQNLFLTDTHDAETMILQSSAFEKVLLEFSSENKLNNFTEHYGSDMRSTLINSALPIGYLRWISALENLSLKFEELNFGDFIGKEDLSIEIRKLIQAVKNNSNKHSIKDEDLWEKIHSQKKGEHNPWQICCGHDLIQILSIGFRKVLGSHNAADVKPEILERDLRLTYEQTDFAQTFLCLSLYKWEKANSPFKVLSEKLKTFATSNINELSSVVEELERLIEIDAKESEFQSLLTNNPWMFGSEYCQLLKRRDWVLGEQLDFMMRRTLDGYLELIEIKTALNGEPLFRKDSSHDSFYARSELSKVVGQVTKYLENLDAEEYRIKAKMGEEVSKIRAKIIIGRSIDREHMRAIKAFNDYHNRIEIITFDQLVSMAKQMLTYHNQAITPYIQKCS